MTTVDSKIRTDNSMETENSEPEHDVGKCNEQRKNIDVELEEVDKLRHWIINSNIPYTKTDKLLNILRPRLMPQLPKCTKTFIGSATLGYKIELMQDADDSLGEFVYLGIEKNLMNCFKSEMHADHKTIYLQFNIDGIPLFKSSAKQFWPILCRIHSTPMIYDPFPVTIYSGNSKPKLLSEYLQKFVQEINILQVKGFIFENKTYVLKVKCFICDTPARAFLKGTVVIQDLTPEKDV